MTFFIVLYSLVRKMHMVENSEDLDLRVDGQGGGKCEAKQVSDLFFCVNLFLVTHFFFVYIVSMTALYSL
jgi:hypothetical protein